MGDNHHDEVENDFLNPHKHEQYDLNSKIMLTAIISLSLVVVFVTILHLYARCLLRRQSRRRAALRQLSLAVIIPEQPKTGLDPSVIATLPIIPYTNVNNVSGETKQTECAVCLSLFENDEMARMLLNCKHIFHVECIDMWLRSSSTCPICRSQAEPRPMVIEPAVAAQPSAPSVDRVNSNLTHVEGSTSENVNQNSGKISGGSKLSSFRRMLNRERSSHRAQSCGEEAVLEDIERQ